jgi:hypothetical protein
LGLGGANVADEHKRLKRRVSGGRGFEIKQQHDVPKIEGGSTLNSSIFFITTSEVRGYLRTIVSI